MALVKNPGPVLTSVFRGLLDVVPPRWRAKLGFTKVDQEQPTDVTPSSLVGNLISSDTIQERTDERKKTDITIGSPSGLSIVDQTFDEQYGFLARVTESFVATGTTLGNALTEVTGLGNGFDTSRLTTVPTAAIEAFVRVFPGTMGLNLPDVLTAISVEWEKSRGDGYNVETGDTNGAGTSWHLDLVIPNSSQGSASVMPELIPVMQRIGTEELDVVDYFFFMVAPTTKQQVINRIAAISGHAINPWPIFKLSAPTFVLKGQKVSLRGDASARVSMSLNVADGASISQATSQGHGLTREFASTIKAVTFPHVLFPNITLTGATSDTETVAVATSAVITGTVSAADNISDSETVNGSVTPTSLSATPSAGYPATGLYLKSLNVENWKWGYNVVRARVFDFGLLA